LVYKLVCFSGFLWNTLWNRIPTIGTEKHDQSFTSTITACNPSFWLCWGDGG